MNGPPNGERRPWQDGARTPATESGCSLPLPVRRSPEEEARLSELAAFLGTCRQRRDDAAHRLPPLADGQRDPLRPATDGAVVGVSDYVKPRRLVAFVYADVSGFPRDALVRGNVGPWLAAEGIPAQRVPRFRGWLVRRESVTDLVARAGLAGVAVFLRGRDARPTPPLPRPVRVARPAVDPPAETVGQLALLMPGEVA